MGTEMILPYSLRLVKKFVHVRSYAPPGRATVKLRFPLVRCVSTVKFLEVLMFCAAKFVRLTPPIACEIDPPAKPMLGAMGSY